MTVRELIRSLRRLPQEMQVRAWCAETDDYVEVTGSIWEDGGMTVDLITDPDEEHAMVTGSGA